MTSDSVDKINESMPIIQDHLVPHQYDPIKCAIHLICAAFGIPLNVFVGAVLICNPSLYSARNTIWIGVIFCNILTLVMGLIEVWAIAGGNEEACLIFTVMMGKPYTMVLANLLLATCDRYVYTKWPLWHEKNVTVFRVLMVEIVPTVLIPCSLTMPYWAFNVPLRCGFDLRGANCAFVAMLILNVLCIISKTVVYIVSRRQTATQLSNGLAVRVIPLTVLQVNSAEPNQEADVEGTTVRVDIADSAGIVAHSGGQYVRQRELEATASLVAGLIPLCVFTLPNLIWVIWHWFCDGVSGRCVTFASVTVYSLFYGRELVLFHVCTNLFVFVFCSKEFKTAVKSNLNR